MSEPAATGPPTPPPHHGLDPIAEAIGELKADVRTLTGLRETMVTKDAFKEAIDGLHKRLDDARLWLGLMVAWLTVVSVLAAWFARR